MNGNDIKELFSLGVAVSPFLVSLGGRNFVWKILALIFSAISAWLVLTVGVSAFFIPWVIAWIFAGVALQGRRKTTISTDVLDNLRQRSQQPNATSHATLHWRKCPFCASQMHPDVIVCSQCGRTSVAGPPPVTQT